jgi:AcrR family transcriptional regulator
MHRGRHHRRRHYEDPRVVRTRAVVLAAARRLLVEEGPEAVTPLRIAEETGVARTTVYRHWPQRDDLLRDTLASEEPTQRTFDTGDLRDDLIGFLEHLSRRVGRRSVGSFLAVVAERAQRDPQAAAVQRDLTKRYLQPLRERLADAAASGELPDDLDVDAAVARLAGPLIFRRLVTRQAVGARFVMSLVDTFLAAPTPP